MSFEELAAIGEFIGGVTVVLTLMYLAYETRRNTAIHRASATSDAYLQWADSNQLIAGDVRGSERWVRIFDNQPLDAFDLVGRFQITLELRAVVQRLAAIHQQHRNGLVDTEFWEIHRTWFAGFFMLSAVSEWWDVEKTSALFTAEFIAELEATEGFRIGPTAQRATNSGPS